MKYALLRRSSLIVLVMPSSSKTQCWRGSSKGELMIGFSMTTVFMGISSFAADRFDGFARQGDRSRIILPFLDFRARIRLGSFRRAVSFRCEPCAAAPRHARIFAVLGETGTTGERRAPHRARLPDSRRGAPDADRASQAGDQPAVSRCGHCP